MGSATRKLFVDIPLYCDELDLIGKEMFAVDGCKMSSNASKEQRGTRSDFEKRREKFGARVDMLVRKHREQDEKGVRGTVVKSSMTDADSAKMVSSRGVVQGYNGIAAVDAKHRVIVGAEAFGKAHDAEVLEPMRDG